MNEEIVAPKCHSVLSALIAPCILLKKNKLNLLPAYDYLDVFLKKDGDASYHIR